jgi:sugar lactone lactonase YvrE
VLHRRLVCSFEKTTRIMPKIRTNYTVPGAYEAPAALPAAKESLMTISSPSLPACLLAAVAGLAGALPAQPYSARVLTRNLLRPTGIVVAGDGTIWLTEVPNPGMSMGNNRVSRIDASGMNQTVLVAGEPEPTHLARSAAGDLYWTCKSAGVIQRLTGTTRTTILRMLEKPSGIAIGGNGVLYFTQLPTPGQSGGMGGRNTVNSWTMTGGVQVITRGEPEPTDVAVDARGNLFWTCRSANVILWRDATTQVVAPLLTRLDKPVGIAIDASGALYFTEVPTPGVGGGRGGRNRVSRYDPATRTLTLVNFGDPEPTDVAVTPDGASVFWTCTSAGVIVKADRARQPITLTANGAARIGTVLPLLLRAPAHGGRMYVAATSLGTGPLRLGDELLALSVDDLLLLSIGGSAPSVFGGYMGLLDQSGAAGAAIAFPNVAALRGMTWFTGYVVFRINPPALLGASDTLRLVLE